MFFNELEIPQTYHLIDTPRKLAWLLKELENAPIYAFDIENTHPTIKNKKKKRSYTKTAPVKIVGISFAWGRTEVQMPWKPGTAAYIPLRRSNESRYWNKMHDSVLLSIKTLLESNTPKVAHNGKFDVGELYKKEGIKVQNMCHDTMLYVSLIDEDKLKSSFGLKSQFNKKGEIINVGVSDVYLDTSASQFKGDLDDALSHYDKDYRRYHKVPLETLYPYACADSDLALSLKLVFEKILKEEGTEWVFKNIMMPLSNTIMQMELKGVPLNIEKAKKVEAEQAIIMQENEKIIHEMAGREFNISSNEQLGNLLFNDYAIKGGTRNKTGWVVDVEELQRIKKLVNHPIIDPVIAYRKAHKIGNTYAAAALDLVDETTDNGVIGWVHPDIRLTSKTGRLRCSDPNLTNLPRKGNGGDIVKGMWECPEDYVFIFKDYSQMELRVIAHVSQEPTWVAGFNAGHDMHSSMAKAIFDLPCDVADVGSLYKEKRTKAKNVNFGIAYGQSIYALAQSLDITYEEAEDLVNNKYFGAAPVLKAWIDYTHLFAETYGYVDNMFGRRRHLPDASMKIPYSLRWPSNSERPDCYRKCVAPRDIKVDLKDLHDISEGSIGQQIKACKQYRHIKCTTCPCLKSCFVNSEVKYLKGKKNRAMRQAVNFEIQGSAADMSSSSLIWITQEMKRHKIDSTPILYIHDEIGCYTHKDHVDAASRVMDDCMSPRLKTLTNFSVPITVDTEVVRCWGDK